MLAIFLNISGQPRVGKQITYLTQTACVLNYTRPITTRLGVVSNIYQYLDLLLHI